MLLRPGAVTAETIEAVLGRPLRARDGIDGETPNAPGQLASHYAPARARAARRDGVRTPARRCWRSGRTFRQAPGRMINLSPTGDLIEAAANLFAALRALDAERGRDDCRHADPRARARRGDQRPAAARGGAARRER